jgi:hypothetical protein
MQLVGMCADGLAPTPPQADPAQALIAARKHSMLDVSYVGSPLVGHYGAGPDKPAPGERFRAAYRLKGGRHHLIMFSKAPRLDDFRAWWGSLVSILDASSTTFDATEAGVPNGSAVLVRPDGFIGFRAAPPDEAATDALDAHLYTYLAPDSK